jgi:hypothetical protein
VQHLAQQCGMASGADMIRAAFGDRQGMTTCRSCYPRSLGRLTGKAALMRVSQQVHLCRVMMYVSIRCCVPGLLPHGDLCPTCILHCIFC